MPNFDFQTTATLIVFAAVILLIAFDVIDMLLAGMLGVSALIVLGIFTAQDVIEINRTADGTTGPAVWRHGGGAHPCPHGNF